MILKHLNSNNLLIIGIIRCSLLYVCVCIPVGECVHVLMHVCAHVCVNMCAQGFNVCVHRGVCVPVHRRPETADFFLCHSPLNFCDEVSLSLTDSEILDSARLTVQGGP